MPSTYYVHRRRKEVLDWGKIRKCGGQKSPSGVQGQTPGLGQKLKIFTVIVGEFLRILGVTAKQFTSIDLEVCIKMLHARGLYFWKIINLTDSDCRENQATFLQFL